MLEEVRRTTAELPGVCVLPLPTNETSARTVNSLQRAADIIMQKSLREGFGSPSPKACERTAGHRRQRRRDPAAGRHHQTGFLVDTPEGAALRIRYLLFKRRSACAW